MIRVTGKGDFRKTKQSLNKMQTSGVYSGLDRYGEMGVEALRAATPVESSLTANSWKYRIIKDKKRQGIEWYNTNKTANGTSIAILIQYGHGTGTGGYVSGRDYINPAMRPIFDRIAEEIWKKVTA